MIPRWIGDRTRHIASSSSECSTKGENRGGEEEGVHLGAHASFAKFVDARRAGEDVVDGEKREREEGCDCKVRRTKALNGDINVPDVCVEGVEALNRGGDESNQHQKDGEVVEFEHQGEPF